MIVIIILPYQNLLFATQCFIIYFITFIEFCLHQTTFLQHYGITNSYHFSHLFSHYVLRAKSASSYGGKRSLWLPNFSVPNLKNFSQNPIKPGLMYQSFLYYNFIQIYINCHLYFCVGVVEHSWLIHTNIFIEFHLPELDQPRHQYSGNTVFE